MERFLSTRYVCIYSAKSISSGKKCYSFHQRMLAFIAPKVCLLSSGKKCFDERRQREKVLTNQLTLGVLVTILFPFIQMNQYDPSAQMKDQMVNKDNSVIVCTEGRLTLDFAFDDMMRIKSWHFATRQHQELIPRSIVAIQASQDPSSLEQMSKNITRQGLTNSTLNYLRVSRDFLLYQQLSKCIKT